MSKDDSAIGAQLRASWDAGDLSVSSRLDKRIQGPNRPGWALGVVRACMDIANWPERAASPVRELIAIGRDPGQWREAHDVFTRLRLVGLDLEAGGRDPLSVELLRISELAAKVIYNASGAPAPFDANSGEKLIQRVLIHAADVSHDRQDIIWHALSHDGRHLG